MTRTGYAWEMSNTPPDPDHINAKRLAGLMRAFDEALRGKALARVTGYEFRKVSVREELEALKQIGINDEPTITYVPRQKERPRHLNPIDMAIYIRDTIRLRKYNEEWIKNNIR